MTSSVLNDSINGKLYKVLITSASFFVSLATSAYEFIKLIQFIPLLSAFDDLNAQSTSIDNEFVDIAFVLYLGSLLSFFLTELIYEPVPQSDSARFNHVRINLLISTSVGMMVSVIGIAISMPLFLSGNYLPYIVAMFVLKSIIWLTFAVSAVSYFLKTIIIWKAYGTPKMSSPVPFSFKRGNISKYKE